MKKRYYLLIFVVLFGTTMWGLVSTIENSTPKVQNGGSIDTRDPDAMPTQKDDLISVDTPLSNHIVTSPLVVSGKARGNWYFEGSFPVTLVDSSGAVIASGSAQAQGEWMTTDYVPFTATLTFTPSSAGESLKSGKVILSKANASGDPQFDNSVTIQVQW